jgi:hypothetical protein
MPEEDATDNKLQKDARLEFGQSTTSAEAHNALVPCAADERTTSVPFCALPGSRTAR